MQKKIIIFLFIALFSLSYSLPILAQEDPTSSAEVTENLKKRLQESLEGETTDSTLSLARAYIGTVKDLIKTNIILEDKDGEKTVSIHEDATILRTPGSATIKAENIQIDDYIIAMGYFEEGDTLSARRIIVSTSPITAPAKSSGHGTISAINKSSLELARGEETQEIFFTTKTVIKTPSELIELTDLEIGDKIVFTATVDKDEDLTATILMKI